MNKTTKRNVVVSSLLAIMLCVSLISGATFALFTSESKTNVAVSSGKVDIVATMEELSIYSPTSIDQNGVIVDETNAATATTFANGGTVTADSNTITLTNITPGDRVSFKINVKNNSNVTVKYRTILACESDTGLFAGLKVMIDGEEYIGETRVSTYETLAAGTGNYTIPVTIELPAAASNAYQGKTMKLIYTVQAVQGNTETNDPENGTYYIYTANDLVLLRYFAPSVNNVVLMNDIDMSGTEYAAWDFNVPAGATFTFDGQGHSIKNLTTSGYTGANNENDFQRVGLFAQVGSASHSQIGTIVFKNLVMDNATVTQGVGEQAAAGALIGLANVVNVEIDGCKVINSHITSGKYAAGFVGYAQEYYDTVSVTVKNAAVEDNELVGNGHTAGLVGLANKTVSVDTATVKGNVISTKLGHSAAALLGTGSVDATGIVATGNTYAGGLKDCDGETKDDIFGIYHVQSGDYVVIGSGENNTIVEAYIILSLFDLKDFRDTVNGGYSFYKKTVQLWTDIDLKNENWEPIGKPVYNGNNVSSGAFSGDFNGLNHTISNLRVNGGVDNPIDLNAVDQGLFGCLYAQGNMAYVRNLKIHNADVYAKNSAGAFVGNLHTYQHVYQSGQSNIWNVELTGKVTIKGGKSGSVCGSPVSAWAILTSLQYVTVNVEAGSYVTNVGVVGAGGNVGGVGAVAAYSSGWHDISSNIDVIAKAGGEVGGIVGVASGKFQDLTYTGNITIVDADSAASKAERCGKLIGVWAPVYRRDYIVDDSLTATGTFKINCTDGTVITVDQNVGCRAY